MKQQSQLFEAMNAQPTIIDKPSLQQQDNLQLPVDQYRALAHPPSLHPELGELFQEFPSRHLHPLKRQRLDEEQ